MDGRFMTIGQAAEYLQLSRETLYKYAQSGRVPTRKVGRHWRFSRSVLDDWMNNRLSSISESGASFASARRSSPASDSMSVLVVDDEPVIRKLLSVWIQLAGHSAETANCGREALDQLQGNAFDAMFLDLHLPDMNGDQVLNEMPSDRSTAVVLITGRPESGIMDEALFHSVTYALAKPFGQTDVQQVLDMISQTN